MKPTASPTRRPTEEPSTNPTNKPTEIPTLRPTNVLTAFPTAKPTESPTLSPTDTLTAFPTENLTEFSTSNPTGAPTSSSPTVVPTNSPTENVNKLNFSECSIDRQYAFNKEFMNFTDSLVACKNEGAVLAQIKTPQHFEDIRSLSPFAVFIWLGMRALDPTADPADPLYYSFLDGTTYTAEGFDSTAGEIPWGNGQPDFFGSDCIV